MRTAQLIVLLFSVAASSFASGELVHLGRPARAMSILAGKIVVDRRTGNELLVLSNNNEASGTELIFLDFEKGTGEVVRAPAGAGAEALEEIPGDKLAVGTFYDGTVMIFDLRLMKFVASKRFESESYIWGFARGSDGRYYFGTYPGGKLGAFDPASLAFEDLGAGAAPNYYLRNVVSTPDGRILCRYLAEKPTWRVFDPATASFASVPEEIASAKSAAVWNGFVIVENRFYDGRDFRRLEQVPFPVPIGMRDRLVYPISSDQEVTRTTSEPTVWAVEPLLTTPEILYFRIGSALWRYRIDDSQARLVSAVDLRGGRILAESKDGRVLGVRGQDYFVLRPGEGTMRLRKIPGEPAPRAISFLKVDQKGRIWGGPPYGQTLFSVDVKTKEFINTPNISDTGGEVYDVAFVRGVVYSAAYAGGEVIRYNPDAPWDQWGQRNPSTITSIGSKGFIRPTGGIIEGPGGKLYSGWTSGLGTYGGAVAVTDPESGKTALFENPLGEQQITGVATDGTVLYIGTGLGGSGLPTKVGESSRLGIIDPTSGQVVWRQDVEGAKRIRVAGYDAVTGCLVTIVDTHVRLFDTASRTLLPETPNAPTVASWSHAVPGDGRFYYGSGQNVLALDLRSGELETLAKAPGLIGNVAVGPDGTVYASVGPDLYAIHGTSKR